MKNVNRIDLGDRINVYEKFLRKERRARDCPCVVKKVGAAIVTCKDARGNMREFTWKQWRIEKVKDG